MSIKLVFILHFTYQCAAHRLRLESALFIKSMVQFLHNDLTYLRIDQAHLKKNVRVSRVTNIQAVIRIISNVVCKYEWEVRLHMPYLRKDIFSWGNSKDFLICKNSRETVKISSSHYLGVNQCSSIIIKWITWPDIHTVVGKSKNKIDFFTQALQPIPFLPSCIELSSLYMQCSIY